MVVEDVVAMADEAANVAVVDAEATVDAAASCDVYDICVSVEAILLSPHCYSMQTKHSPQTQTAIK